MPNNPSPDTLITMLQGIERRLNRIENSPQTGNSSIMAGALQILDPTGKLVLSLGYQPDGSLGLAAYDPASGQKAAQMGQVGGGLYGLSVRNTATGADQLLAGTSSSETVGGHTLTSTTPVSFGDDPTVTTTIGASGKALVVFGASIGTGGDSDQGVTSLTVDGVVVHSVAVSSAAPTAGVQANVSRTTIVDGMTPGAHTFSLSYFCTSGVHGITVSNRFITVSPL